MALLPTIADIEQVLAGSLNGVRNVQLLDYLEQIMYFFASGMVAIDAVVTFRSSAVQASCLKSDAPNGAATLAVCAV